MTLTIGSLFSGYGGLDMAVEQVTGRQPHERNTTMTDKMTRQQVLETVAAARDKAARPDLAGLDLSYLDLSHLNLRDANLSGVDLSGADLAHTNLSCSNLSHTNMRYADLHDANLCGVDLGGATLRYADLRYAKLYDVDLRYVDLRYANLYDVDLHNADLRYTHLIGLLTTGLPSGNLTFIPTPEGWNLSIGCWKGTTDTLREMIAGDEGWPKAEGEEIAVRRPMLAAMADACDAYAAAHPDAVAEVKAAANRRKKNR